MKTVNTEKPDSLTLERIWMENLGRGFIVLLVVTLVFAGHYFLNL
jgi:hypothetical protein